MKEFSVPASTMLDGKLFQLFITLLVKKTGTNSRIITITMYNFKSFNHKSPIALPYFRLANFSAMR